MDSINFIAPLDKFTPTAVESALAEATRLVFAQELQSRMQDLLDYGAPFLGGRTVVERFTKQDGLVVLRRPVVSDTIMRVILANWSSLASERGLGFLEFVLTMLWEQEWSIVRLWHSSAMAEQYPRFLSRTRVPGYFLTSRIHLNIKESVDLAEIAELTPVIRQLVPANIVVSVIAEALNRDFEKNIAVAMAAKVYQIQDLSQGVDYRAQAGVVTQWIIDAVTMASQSVTYHGYIIDQMQYYTSYATLPLVPLLVKSFHNEDMQQWQAFIDAANALSNNEPWSVNTSNETLEYAVHDEINATTLPMAWMFIASNGTRSYHTSVETAAAAWHSQFPWYPIVKSAYYTSSTSYRYEIQSATSETAGVYTAFQLVSNPYYNSNSIPPIHAISLSVVAQRILSNVQSENQGISLLAETYINHVVQSYFAQSPDPRFVTLIDLIDQLEANKVLTHVGN